MRYLARFIFLLTSFFVSQSLFAQSTEKDLPVFYQELNRAESNNDTAQMIMSAIRIANTYQFMNIPDSSFYYNTFALKLSILEHDTAAMSGCYTNLGAETFNRGLYGMSKDFLNKAVHLDSLTGNEKQLALNLSFLGLVYGIQYIDAPDNQTFRNNSLSCVRKALSLDGDEYSRFNSYYAMTQYAMWDKKNDSVKYYYEKFSDIAVNSSLKPMKVSLDVDYLLYCKQHRKAIDYLLSQKVFFEKSKISMRFYYEKLTYVYEVFGDYKNAYETVWKEFRCQREISDDNTTRAIANVEAEKAAEVERIKREESEKVFAEQRKHLNTLIIALSVGLCLVLLVVVQFYRMWKIKRRANKILYQQKTEIEAQRDKIAFQNNEILSSINYAERIQRAAIPSQSDVNKLFPESFVYYKPRDIVSGDYYWAVKCGRFSVMITADCTGHGIPGAFLSMLGISSLKEFLATESDAEIPGMVLDKMRGFIKATLISKNDERVDDGMDMTVCCFDFEAMELRYALANQSAYIIRNGESIKLKGDRMPVGRYIVEKEHFQSLSVKLCKGDMVYMFSDGFQDQLGGTESDFGHKFMSKNLVVLLTGIYAQPMETQKTSIENAFNAWRNNRSQTDDVTLVGIRV